MTTTRIYIDEAARMLTKDRTAIRSLYKAKKHLDALLLIKCTNVPPLVGNGLCKN